MFLDGLIIGVILAYLRGGSFKGFDKIDIKGDKLILGLFLIYFALSYLAYNFGMFSSSMIYWANGISLILAYFAWINRHLPGFTLILLGILLNLIVIAANGGKMPVSIEAANMVDPKLVELLGQMGYKHAPMTEETRLWFLADIIPLLPPYPNHKVISIGDVLLNVGGFLFVWKTMFLVKRKQKGVIGGELG